MKKKERKRRKRIIKNEMSTANQIGDEGAKILCGVLKRNSNLISLNLSGDGKRRKE